jgi:hypothetical protein
VNATGDAETLRANMLGNVRFLRYQTGRMTSTDAGEETKSERKRSRDEDEPRRGERPRRKVRRPVDDDEPTPVISGRFLAASALVLGMTVIPMSNLGQFFEPKDPTVPKPTTWQVGSKATVAITLITADYNKLTCAHEKEFAGYHCAFKSENEAWPRDPAQPIDDNKATIVQPYRTWLDNQLILVGGLWAQPAVATRLHREPPAGIDEEKLARFVVECQVTFVAKMDGVKLRWGPGQWTNPDMTPMLAKPESCKMIEAEPP